MMKRAYFMTVIDGVLHGHAHPRHVSVVTLDYCEIMGNYNTPDTVVRDKRTM